MEDIQFEIVSGSCVDDACRAVLARRPTPMPVLVSFSGSRVSCCDEAAVARKDGNVVGVATLAPEGEISEGRPTLVGIWVDPASARGGIGSQLVAMVVKRAEERGLQLPVLVEAVDAGLADWFRRRPCAALLDVRLL